MTLAAGSHIGPYEIVAPIGAGGMGEVYRARDAQLNRDVAIKVLPDLFAADPERLKRFEREAQTLAALNHPNIAQIYGVVDLPTAAARDGHALVMEFVDGEDLARRIARGPIPVDDALAIARQVVAALEAAHDRGIVHRDLKPANVKVRPDGTVKVLDFGLAKAMVGEFESTNPTNSPTITSPMTQMGVILGTAAYMAPEQARGKRVDKRADIWAFGCLFYEMLTGRRPFDAEDVTDVITKILRDEPDWTRLAAVDPPLSPVVDRYLHRCLEKKPAERVQDIGDVRLALDGAFDIPIGSSARPVRARRWPAVAAGLTLAIAAAAAVWVLKPGPSARPAPVVRFTFQPAPAIGIANRNRDLVITPDGSSIVYVGQRGTGRDVFVHRLDRLGEAPLGRADRYYEPFASPDNQWVAFNDESDYTLKKVPVSGGPAVSIAVVGSEILGATWGSDGTIVYATDLALFRVPAAGGKPVSIGAPDAARGELALAWPEFLPGARALLLAVRWGPLSSDVGIEARDLRSGAMKMLVRGATSPHYSPTGHLLFLSADGSLRAVSFDPDALEIYGDPIVVAEGIMAKASGGANYSIAANGTLAYVGGVAAVHRPIAWFDRDGSRHPIPVPDKAYVIARISPDGTRIALDARDDEQDIWIWDIAHESLTRLTDSPRFDGVPVWTRDSRQVLFTSGRTVPNSVFVQNADGSGVVQQVLKDAVNNVAPMSLTPDGRGLLFRSDSPRRLADIMSVPLDGSAPPSPVLTSAADEVNGEVSPDGRYLAYESNESGSPEVYVRPFPDVQSGRWRMSTNGGRHPVWAAGGRELYYVSGDMHLQRVDVTTSPAFHASAPTAVLSNPIYAAIIARSYDVTPDGKRYLVIEDPPRAQDQPLSITVVSGWGEDVKRLLPNRAQR